MKQNDNGGDRGKIAVSFVSAYNFEPDHEVCFCNTVGQSVDLFGGQFTISVAPSTPSVGVFSQGVNFDSYQCQQLAVESDTSSQVLGSGDCSAIMIEDVDGGFTVLRVENLTSEIDSITGEEKFYIMSSSGLKCYLDKVQVFESKIAEIATMQGHLFAEVGRFSEMQRIPKLYRCLYSFGKGASYANVMQARNKLVDRIKVLAAGFIGDIGQLEFQELRAVLGFLEQGRSHIKQEFALRSKVLSGQQGSYSSQLITAEKKFCIARACDEVFYEKIREAKILLEQARKWNERLVVDRRLRDSMQVVGQQLDALDTGLSGLARRHASEFLHSVQAEDSLSGEFLYEGVSEDALIKEVVHIKVQDGEITTEVSLNEILKRSEEDIKVLLASGACNSGVSYTERDLESVDEILIEDLQGQISYSNKEEIQEKRRAAMQQVIENGNTYITENYELSPGLIRLLEEKNIDLSQFETCTGNPFQQVLHQESLEVAEGATIILSSSGEDVTALQDLALDFAQTSSQLNAVGSQIEAIQLLDWCWTALDYGKAVGEGVAEGVINSANMVLHPIDTIKGMAKGTAVLGAYLGRLIYHTASMAKARLDMDILEGFKDQGSASAKLFLEAQEQFEQKKQMLSTVAKGAYEGVSNYVKNTPPREIVKQGVAFGIEMILWHKAGKSAEKFLKKVGPSFMEYTRKVKEVFNRGEEAGIAIAGPAGMDIPVFTDAIETLNYLYEESRAVAGRARGAVNSVCERAAGTQTGQRLGRVSRQVRKYCVGFTDLQAIELMKKTGGKFVIESESIIEQLRNFGFTGNEIKYSVEYFKHFFGQIRKDVLYSSGAIRTVKSGGHHAGNPFLKIKNWLVRSDQVMEASIRTARYRSGEIVNALKTLTPNYWSVEKTAMKIHGSFKNILKIYSKKTNTINIICSTDCGIKIEHVINLVGDSITTFFYKGPPL